jgi:hypothetical protein
VGGASLKEGAAGQIVSVQLLFVAQAAAPRMSHAYYASCPATHNQFTVRANPRVSSSSISEPGVEDFQLFFGRIDEYDAHADPLVYVDHLAIRDEGFVVAGDDDPQRGVHGKRVRGVHVASLAADFRHPSHDTHGAAGFDEFRDGQDGITRYRALRAVRPV